MPVVGETDGIQVFPAQIDIPVEAGLFVTVQIQTDGSPEAAARVTSTQQELIDYLQDWPGRLDIGNVTGSLYDVTMFNIGPTHPLPIEPPPDGKR